jgi:hypothetical protein
MVKDIWYLFGISSFPAEYVKKIWEKEFKNETILTIPYA